MVRALKILLAEDEPSARKLLEDGLHELGHQVTAVANGRQLVESATAAHPDLIVTDIVMPELDGIEAIRRVNQQQQTPAILISGYHSPEHLERAQTLNVMAYIVKPFKRADLEAAIAVALARFAQYQQVCTEAADLRQAIEDRKTIERAKGSVMRRLSVDEQEAFRRLKKLASERNSKMADVARSVLDSEEIFRAMDRL